MRTQLREWGPITRRTMQRAIRDGAIHGPNMDASMSEVGIVAGDVMREAYLTTGYVLDTATSPLKAGVALYAGAFELGVRCGLIAAGLVPSERVCPRCQVGWRTFDPPLRCSFCNRPTLAGRLAQGSVSL